MSILCSPTSKHLLNLTVLKDIFPLFLLIGIFLFGATACDYSKYGNDHTMCKYEAQACKPTARGFTTYDAAVAVKAHNEKRQKVASGNQPHQPEASNMHQVYWNSELAAIAQRWADQCHFGHDANRRSHKYIHVGQNVFLFGSTQDNKKINIQEAIDAWYNEVTKPGFNSKNIRPFKFESGNGHYTQMVWAQARTIGCGYSYYKKDNWYNKLIVCNYGPGGNIIEGEMYKIGKPCSNCPNGCSKDYSALCK